MKYKFSIAFILLSIMALFFTACSNTQTIRYISEEAISTPSPLIQPIATESPIVSEENIQATQTPDTIKNTVVITEISSSNGDWIEFSNFGESDILLSDYRLGTSADFSKAKALPELIIKPREYVCVFGKNEQAHDTIDIAISKNGETLYLFSASGTLHYAVTVPALGINTSYVFNGTDWAYTYIKTPGMPNDVPVFNSPIPTQFNNDCPLRINEVLVSNSYAVSTGYSEYSDFVEIFNPSDHAVSLKGWFLSDSVDDAAKWAFPDIRINAGEYLVIYLSGNESIEGELHSSFSLRDGEAVILFNGNDNRYLLFSFPSTLIKNISVGPDNAYYRFPTPGYANSAPIDDISKIGFYFADDVYFSEVCAQGEEKDWIEIYNGSDIPVDLSGWSITDSLGDTAKFRFTDVSLASGAYFVIETSSHVTEQIAGIAKFGLSISGDTLYLIDNLGRVRDCFNTGMSEDAASSGRIESVTDVDRVFFSVATPGKKNSDSFFTGRTLEPAFSHTNLYCSEAFKLVLTAEEDAAIYYSSDGSEPKKSSKNLYSEPITISKNTVIRAVAVKEGQLNSKVVTYTYLFEEAHEVPVVCIAMSPADKEDVWSAKSKQSKTKVEREGYLSYYETDGKMGVSFPAGFKPKGAGTLGRSQASLSIHLRGNYGQSNVTYPFFKEYGWETYASLVVRNAGQDYTKGRIRDSLASRLCFGLNIDVSATHPVAVYVNGKYYGLYDLNEDQNADFLHTHYGVDTRIVEIIRFNTVAVKGSNSEWKKIIEFAKTKDFKKDSVYEEFIQWVDPDYFMDYLICSIYLCNSDMANQKYWHTTDNSIRWRPIFYDFDYAIGFNRSAKSSIMERFFDSGGTATATSRIYTHIACALVKNPTWREKFIERYIEITYTVFDPDRVNGILDQLVSEMEPEMSRHIAKWGSRNAPASVKVWHENIEEIKDWFSQRQKYAIESLQKYFKLSDEEIKRISADYKNN